MSLLNLWEKAQGAIKEKVGATSYETWFSSLQVKEKDSNTLIIETPDNFFKNWIIEHYQKTIGDTFQEITTQAPTIEFEVNAQITAAPVQLPGQTAAPERLSQFERNFTDVDLNLSHLNPRFTFDNFVIGPSNRFAYAASLAVAESPAKAYNPLFIYGPVGLGKTHLMQAITHQIRIHHPSANISYLSSERFTNELIDAIRHRSTNQFRQKYRNIDVLLIDDIHFIAGKESTQEEFFHTFNALHNNRKQIIISSDRPPKEIANLEERLISRFTWGLITDIQPPNFETRVAILRKKIEKEPIQVPDNVINFIAEQVTTNIRELEGALIRVVAYSLLDEKPVSLDMARMILKDTIKQTIKIITIEMVQKQVTEFFNISLSDLKANVRNKKILYPRQIAMYLSRKLTSFSLPEIGKAFGGKDHTTVLHSFNKILRDLETNEELKNTLEKLINSIKREL
jgi:chromosomal replication initiator protein